MHFGSGNRLLIEAGFHRAAEHRRPAQFDLHFRVANNQPGFRLRRAVSAPDDLQRRGTGGQIRDFESAFLVGRRLPASVRQSDFRIFHR